MSYKASLIKLGIKLTPKSLIAWVANKILKDIAELKYLEFNLDERKSYVEIQLMGEPETIEVWLDGFHIMWDPGDYAFVIEGARSNKLWLGNALSRVVGKAWKIPVPPRFAAPMALAAEILGPKP